MNITIPQALIHDHRLRRAELATMIALYSWAGCNTIYAGHRSIAERAGLARETVCRALKRLESLGWVVIEKRPGRTAIYRLTEPIQWIKPQKSAVTSKSQVSKSTSQGVVTPVVTGGCDRSDHTNTKSNTNFKTKQPASATNGALALAPKPSYYHRVLTDEEWEAAKNDPDAPF